MRARAAANASRSVPCPSRPGSTPPIPGRSSSACWISCAPAPGPGAAAYSAAKAALTQLARVAALELGRDNIRVNAIHPNAVFDTGVWTDEVLQGRAQSYGMSVEEYRANNVLHTEVSAQNVADMVCAMAGSTFAKTTGAQVPVDGGNERVI